MYNDHVHASFIRFCMNLKIIVSSIIKVEDIKTIWNKYKKGIKS